MYFCWLSWPILGRTNASASDESVDWRPFGLSFALVLGHACPVVQLSSVLLVCIVCNSVLGWGSPPFEMEPSLTE